MKLDGSPSPHTFFLFLFVVLLLGFPINFSFLYELKVRSNKKNLNESLVIDI